MVVADHDLSVLEYLSDLICCLYGIPGAYGVVALPISVRYGIDIFLSGYLCTENLRFRAESLNFMVRSVVNETLLLSYQSFWIFIFVKVKLSNSNIESKIIRTYVLGS